MGPDDVRIRQLSRMLGRSITAPIPLDDAGPLADAIFEEAANSDDVTDRKSAAAYLEARIAFFAEMLPPSTARKVRERFTGRWDSWERV